jgi:hypothetical protein
MTSACCLAQFSYIILRVKVRVTLRRAVYRQSFRLGAEPLKTHCQYFLSTEHLSCYSPYISSSLTRRWVCRIQLLLVIASTVIFVSESHGTHDHILLSQIRESPNLEGQVPPEQFGSVKPPPPPRH